MISTTPAGYSLHVRELDADRFMELAVTLSSPPGPTLLGDGVAVGVGDQDDEPVGLTATPYG